MLLGYCSKRQRRAIAAAQHALLLYEDLFPAQVTVTVSAVERARSWRDKRSQRTNPVRSCGCFCVTVVVMALVVQEQA